MPPSRTRSPNSGHGDDGGKPPHPPSMQHAIVQLPDGIAHNMLYPPMEHGDRDLRHTAVNVGEAWALEEDNRQQGSKASSNQAPRGISPSPKKKGSLKDKKKSTSGRKGRASISSSGLADLMQQANSQHSQGDKPDMKKPGAVFADASAMKEKIREAVSKKEYNVADLYFETGIAQKIATNQIFEYITLGVIAFNALWIAVDTDGNDADLLTEAKLHFQIAEHAFCAYFTFEWTVRFFAFKIKKSALGDMWFCFDSFLVIMMVLETWVLTIIVICIGGSSGSGLSNTSMLKLVRLVRLTRMARMARLLRALPELIILIKGIVVASRSVFFTLLLLVLIMYFYAVVLRQLLGQLTDGSESAELLINERFPSVPTTMWSLLLDGVLPDQSAIVRDSSAEHPILGFIVLSFVMLASLTVMNMLVGVLCEVVSVVSSVEKEQLSVSYVKQRLLQLFEDLGVDEDDDNKVSKAEFDSLLMQSEAARIIAEIGVDVVGLVDMADYIFKDGVELSFADFMELILQMRGSNSSTVKDIVDMRRFLLTELSGVGNRLDKVTNAVNRMTGYTEEEDVLRTKSGAKSQQHMIREHSAEEYAGVSDHLEFGGGDMYGQGDTRPKTRSQDMYGQGDSIGGGYNGSPPKVHYGANDNYEQSDSGISAPVARQRASQWQEPDAGHLSPSQNPRKARPSSSPGRRPAVAVMDVSDVEDDGASPNARLRPAINSRPTSAHSRPHSATNSPSRPGTAGSHRSDPVGRVCPWTAEDIASNRRQPRVPEFTDQMWARD
jgi:hypothetical protein